MKKFFTVFFIAILTLLIITVSIPFLLPREVIKDNIQNEVRYYTGRDLEFADMKLMFWPDMGVELNGVSFANFDGAKNAKMLSVDKIEVAVAVKPLLDRVIEVKKLVLKNPSINLEFIDATKGSFSFIDKVKEQAPEAGQPQGETKVEEQKTASDMQLKLGRLFIENGSLNLINKGAVYDASAINLEVLLPNMQSAMEVKGSTIYNGKQIDASVSLDKPLDFMAGQVSQSLVTVVTQDGRINLRGELSKALEKTNIDVTADIASLPEMLNWATKGKVADTAGFKKVKLVGALKAEVDSVTLTKTDIDLDNVKLSGDIDIDFAGKTTLFARLKTGELNIDAITKKINEAKTKPEAEVKPEQVASAAVYDLSALKKMNLDVIVATQGLVVDGMKIGTKDVKLQVNDGALSLKTEDATLYDGKFSATLNAKAGDRPSFSAELDVNGMNAKDLLSKFAGFDKLTGKVNTVARLQSSGNSMDKIISSLDGQGSVSFKDGGLQGIDMLDIATNIKNRASGMNAGTGTTKFIELGGTFKILDGVISNNDLKMKAADLSASGKGTIDLPKRYVDYYVTPVLMSKSEKVEGKEANIAVPVYISGKFDNIRVKPDLKAIALKALKDPKEAKQQLKNLRDNVKEQLQSLKEGAKAELKAEQTQLQTDAPAGNAEAPAEEIQNDPVKALGNFFGSVLESVKNAQPGAPVEAKPEAGSGQ